MSKEVFPNGFTSWYETFYVVCQHIEYLRYKSSPLTEMLQVKYGSTKFWVVAKDITNAFEKDYTNEDWAEQELLFEEVVEKFIYLQLETLNKEHEDK